MGPEPSDGGLMGKTRSEGNQESVAQGLRAVVGLGVPKACWGGAGSC